MLQTPIGSQNGTKLDGLDSGHIQLSGGSKSHSPLSATEQMEAVPPAVIPSSLAQVQAYSNCNSICLSAARTQAELAMRYSSVLWSLTETSNKRAGRIGFKIGMLGLTSNLGRSWETWGWLRVTRLSTRSQRSFCSLSVVYLTFQSCTLLSSLLLLKLNSELRNSMMHS